MCSYHKKTETKHTLKKNNSNKTKNTTSIGLCWFLYYFHGEDDVIRICIYSNSSNVHIKYMQFFVYQWYINKTVFLLNGKKKEISDIYKKLWIVKKKRVIQVWAQTFFFFFSRNEYMFRLSGINREEEMELETILFLN